MPLPAHRPQCEMPTRQWGDLHSTRIMVVFAVMFTFANDQSLQFSARRGLLQSVAEGCRLGSFKLANSPLESCFKEDKSVPRNCLLTSTMLMTKNLHTQGVLIWGSNRHMDVMLQGGSSAMTSDMKQWQTPISGDPVSAQVCNVVPKLWTLMHSAVCAFHRRTS